MSETALRLDVPVDLWPISVRESGWGHKLPLHDTHRTFRFLISIADIAWCGR